MKNYHKKYLDHNLKREIPEVKPDEIQLISKVLADFHTRAIDIITEGLRKVDNEN